MSERTRIPLLIGIMTLVALVVGGVSIALLYRAALEQEKERLTETVRSQARLLEAVARFDAEHSQEYPGGSLEATLTQIRDAHERYAGFGETGEFTLARREGDLIVFLLSHRHHDMDLPQPIPFDTELAEPQRRALSGGSGTMIGPDYRGATVLAAYEPVAELGWGIVAKIDLAEVRAPFVRAAILASLCAAAAMVVGASAFFRVTNPLLSRLEKSEQRFRLSFENANIGMCLVDVTGRLLRVNSQMSQIFGYSRDELEGITVNDITHPDYVDVSPDFIQRASSGETSAAVFEKRYFHKDGHTVWGQVASSLVRDAEGASLYFISHVQDITERKQAESQRDASLEALQREKEFSNILVNSSVDGILAFDTECRYTVWNSGMERISGVGKAEALGNIAFEVFPFLEETGEDEYFFGALAGKTALAADRLYRVPETGRQGYFEGHYSPLIGASGEILGGLAVIRDITERKQAEEVLKTQARVLESMAEGVNVCDESGMILSANPAFEAMFGYEPGELVGKHVTVLNAGEPQESARVAADIMEQVETHGTWLGKVNSIRKDGTPFITSAHITALDVSGKDHWVNVMADITEQVRAQEKIQASLQEKEVLLREIHHRVKNNLQVISSLLDLQSESVQDPHALHAFQESRGRVRSMALVHDRLVLSPDLARIDAGGHIQELVDLVVGGYGYGAPDITLNVEVDDIWLGIDTAIPVSLIVNELVSNALKHAFPAGTGPGREIGVEFRSVDGRLMLIVRDNGVGLPPDLDLPNAETLGLQLVTLLTQQLGGSVEVDRGTSVPEGNGGTTFRIVFGEGAQPTIGTHPNP